MATSQPQGAIMSASPLQSNSVEQSIEREESEEVMSEDEHVVADGAPKTAGLTAKEHEIIKVFVDQICAFKDEKFV